MENTVTVFRGNINADNDKQKVEIMYIEKINFKDHKNNI